MGHRLTKDGLSSDPAKVKAVIDMSRPDSRKAVGCFLGCLQCLSRFLPQLAEIAAPLRLLTKTVSHIYLAKANKNKHSVTEDYDHQSTSFNIL